MSVFPSLDIESIVQVGDRTRLSAARSLSNDPANPMQIIEIQPSADADWYDVSISKILDWEYQTAGNIIASVRVTTDDGAKKSATRMIQVLSFLDDNLFSSDDDIRTWEPGILDFLPEGKSSFKSIHREAQNQILDWLDQHAIWDNDNNPLTAAAVVDTKEVREWSKFLTLQIIFEGISNAVDDVYSQKAKKYEALAQSSRNRSELKLDLNGDGSVDKNEHVRSGSVGAKRE